MSIRTWSYHSSCLLFGAAVFLAALTPIHAQAQVARIELHTLQSTTLTDQEFLTGKKEGKPVIVPGELRIPTPGTDRLPAVVLVHGSGGVSGYVDEWAQWLNAMRVATFVFDSFTPRGIVSTVNDQSQLGRLAMIIDAYRALERLGRHPRIDPQRIAIMGFSRGGSATLYASLTRFQRMYGSAAGPEFAAYIVFYPDCRTTYLHDQDVAAKPIRILHGKADDYNPVDACRLFVERLQRGGKDVQLSEYADAHHVFDWPALKTPLKLPQAQTTRRCRPEEAADGLIINSQTRQPFTYADPCVELGPTVAYNAKAHSEAQKAVQELVTDVLKPK